MYSDVYDKKYQILNNEKNITDEIMNNYIEYKKYLINVYKSMLFDKNYETNFIKRYNKLYGTKYENFDNYIKEQELEQKKKESKKEKKWNLTKEIYIYMSYDKKNILNWLNKCEIIIGVPTTIAKFEN